MQRRALLAVSLLAFTSALALTQHARAARETKAPPSGAVSYAALEQEVVSEINLARTRPAEYATYLEALRSMYAGKEFRRPGRPGLLTEEGTGALDEAVKFMRAARPLPALAVSNGMCYGARELVKEQAASGATGHKGADGSFCEQRTGRFGAWREPIGENLSYGDETARERVLTLLIDDGFANRGHRQRLLGAAYKVVGVACGDHKLGALCVITLAGGFAEGPAATKTPTAPKSAAPSGARRF
jgi:uncharacterized protein YkwD